MSLHLRIGAATLLSAVIASGCSGGGRPPSHSVRAVVSSGLERAGSLSVSAFDFTGWRDANFHYLPTLTVTAPSAGRPVFVQRVDFTTDDVGARRLLKGVRYDQARRIQPGGSVALLPDGASPDRAEIVSPLALASISAMVFFTDGDGQSGVVSAARSVHDVRLRDARQQVTSPRDRPPGPVRPD